MHGKRNSQKYLNSDKRKFLITTNTFQSNQLQTSFRFMMYCKYYIYVTISTINLPKGGTTQPKRPCKNS